MLSPSTPAPSTVAALSGRCPVPCNFPPTRCSCLVYDLGSRNKKRGAPRAIWYGLEWVRFALHYLWGLGEEAEQQGGQLQQQGGQRAYLRGYSVADVFMGHVRGLSDGTKKCDCCAGPGAIGRILVC